MTNARGGQTDNPDRVVAAVSDVLARVANADKYLEGVSHALSFGTAMPAMLLTMASSGDRERNMWGWISLAVVWAAVYVALGWPRLLVKRRLLKRWLSTAAQRHQFSTAEYEQALGLVGLGMGVQGLRR